MADDIQAFLDKLPEPTELIRRSNLVHAIHENLQLGSDRIDLGFNAVGANRYFWEDGSGQETNIIWRADGTHDDSVLLLGYDHESAFNFYDTPDAYNAQVTLRDLPEPLTYLGDEKALGWDFDDHKMVYASSSAWWDATKKAWVVSDRWREAALAQDDDGGLEYCLDIFTIEPTVENYVQHLTYQGFDQDEASLRTAVEQALGVAKTPTPDEANVKQVDPNPGGFFTRIFGKK